MIRVRLKPKRGPSVFSTPRQPGDGGRWTPRRRKEILLLGLAFAVLVAGVTRFEPEEEGAIDLEAIQRQTVADRDYVAEFAFETEDIEETRALRSARAEAVPEVYNVDAAKVTAQLEAYDEALRQLTAHRQALAAALRTRLEELEDQPGEAQRAAAAMARDYVERNAEAPPFDAIDPAAAVTLMTPAVRLETPEIIGPADESPAGEAEDEAAGETEGPDQEAAEAPAPAEPAWTISFPTYAGRIGRTMLEQALNRGVLAEEPAQGPEETVIVQRDEPLGGLPLQERTEARALLTEETARDLLQTRIRQAVTAEAGEAARLDVSPERLEMAAWNLAAAHLEPTASFDVYATQRERETAAQSVEPAMRTYVTGEKIQDKNKRWTEQSRQAVARYYGLTEQGERPVVGALATLGARAILVGLALMCLAYGFPVFLNGQRDVFACLNRALLIMCVTVLAGHVAYYFDPTGLIVPVGAAAILLAILIGVRAACFTGILTAFLLSVQYGYDWRLFVEGGAMSIAGALGIIKVRRRNDMAAAAIKATLAGLVTILAVTLANEGFATGEAFQRMGRIGLNGVATLFLVPGLLPPLERIFKVTTDIQLLEYSDLNNEVLSRMAVEVPATYSHSLMLGQVAEAAAEAIGANGLLARVCAYYHDIGKLRRPEYFSENQTGQNVHEEMSPRMSARAIASHVVEGAKMAREFRLPQPIVDGVLEHHGTCKISFFYQQALEQQKHADVNETDFRYPGPKPQSRETAILMICDAAESGVRSIKNLNEERVQEFVERIIDERAADGQFDDCDLTLKQLSIIGRVVAQRLLATRHRRVAYPEQKEKAASTMLAVTGAEE